MSHPTPPIRPSTSAILYQNASKTTTLLDLPGSIQLGQNFSTSTKPTSPSLSASSPPLTLLCTPPLEKPYPSTEPKRGSSKRQKLLDAIPEEERNYHAEIQALVADSLREVREAGFVEGWEGEGVRWCLPRCIAADGNGEAESECEEYGVVASTQKRSSSARSTVASGASLITAGREGFSIVEEAAETCTMTASGLQPRLRWQQRRVQKPAPEMVALRGAKKKQKKKGWVNLSTSSTVMVPAAAAPPPLILTPSAETCFSSLDSIHGFLVCHPSVSLTARLKITNTDQTFLIPPNATFLLSSVQSGITTISTWATRLLPPQTASSDLERQDNPRKFDFILLDPPWPNRSVKNARSKTYRTPSYSHYSHSHSHSHPSNSSSKTPSSTLSEDPFTATLPLLTPAPGGLLSPTGKVGVWITNKPCIRKRVIDSLSSQGLELFEEWIWAKVTASGQPVTDLDGIWRRPWEVLLLFRVVGGANCCGFAEEHAGEAQARKKPSIIITTTTTNTTPYRPDKSEMTVHGAENPQPSLIHAPSPPYVPPPHQLTPKRILISVPDLHSRKPCLKELLEQSILTTTTNNTLSPQQQQPAPTHTPKYRALEIFARNLTAGWWSWGDQVVRFNAGDCWVRETGGEE